MFQLISNLLGGLGMFLLGMTLMSESLKNFAGDSLRATLLRFTGRPLTAFASGMSHGCAIAGDYHSRWRN